MAPVPTVQNTVLFCVISLLNLCDSSIQQTVHVVAPVYKEYASVGVMINSFFAQTSDNWTLTLVSDGKDDRMEALVKLYSSIPLSDRLHDHSPDPRINYLYTPHRANDGGHSPRAFGLDSLPATGWTVLSGGDNYYCPLFIESLLGVIDSKKAVGFIYYDFVLDRKGNRPLPPLTATTAETDPDTGYLVNIPIFIGDVSHDLSFNEGDDLLRVASRFAEDHGLMEGSGCEEGGGAGTDCVTQKLVAAMQEELRRALSGQRPAWTETLDRYEGYVSTSLQQGEIDIGAFAFPSYIGQRVGYRWRHHSADWSFASHVLEEVEKVGLQAHHLKRTLYVHN